MLNESVLQVLNSNAWRAKTLVESAHQGTFFTISESEFQRLLEKEQISEGLKDLLQKAKNAAARLPGNIQQAGQAVKNAAEKASLNVGSLYQKAQDQLDKIPLVGKIPPQTRNRLIMGLALSMIGSMAGAHASDGGGHVDTGGFDPSQHHDPGAINAGHQDVSNFGHDQAVGGDQDGGNAGGDIPTPGLDLENALSSSKGKIIDHANDLHGVTDSKIRYVTHMVSDGEMSVKDAQDLLNKLPGVSKSPDSQNVLQDLLNKAAKVAQADGKKAPESQAVDQAVAQTPSSATSPASNTQIEDPSTADKMGIARDVQNIASKHMKASDNQMQQQFLNKAVSAVQSGKPVDAVMKILNQKFPDMGEFHSGMVRDFLQSKVSNK